MAGLEGLWLEIDAVLRYNYDRNSHSKKPLEDDGEAEINFSFIDSFHWGIDANIFTFLDTHSEMNWK